MLTMRFPLGWLIPFAPIGPSLDSGLEEIETLFFYTYGDYLLPLSLLLLWLKPSLEAQILASWPKSHPQGSNPSLENQILALRPKSQP